jgi:hypothetical protein
MRLLRQSGLGFSSAFLNISISGHSLDGFEARFHGKIATPIDDISNSSKILQKTSTRSRPIVDAKITQ